MNDPDLRSALDELLDTSEGELRASTWAALTLHVVLTSGRELSDRPAAERRFLELLWEIPPPPEDNPERTRVLVVEDSELVARAVRRLLGPTYEIVWAADGLAAREFLASGRSFDVILSDVQMPRLDGFGLLRWVRTDRPYMLLRFVFMTADPETRAARLIAMTHPLLRKPFSREILRDAVRAAKKAGEE